MNINDYGIYGLLVGVEKASQDLNLPIATIKQSILNLLSVKSKFLNKSKQLVLEKAMKENTKAASKQLGVHEYLIIEMLKKYLSEEANLIGNSIYPYDTYDRFTQTCELPAKNWSHMACQVDLPYKQTKSKYTTLEKIEEIRKSLQDSSTVPSTLLEKWKEKVKKSLFQESHIEYYAESKKDRFFHDIDSTLLEWYKKKARSEDDIRDKCREIVGFGDTLIKISDNWIQAFKIHHQLG